MTVSVAKGSVSRLVKPMCGMRGMCAIVIFIPSKTRTPKSHLTMHYSSDHPPYTVLALCEFSVKIEVLNVKLL